MSSESNSHHESKEVQFFFFSNFCAGLCKKTACDAEPTQLRLHCVLLLVQHRAISKPKPMQKSRHVQRAEGHQDRDLRLPSSSRLRKP